MSESSIQWTDMTWNPVRGCSRVSPGCENCYAETMAARFSKPGFAFEGYAKQTKAGARWTRKVDLIIGKLLEPLRWRKPKMVFVNSMSDLFHEKLRFDEIASVFGVMALCPQHKFQILTKRPERALEFFGWIKSSALLRALPIGEKCIDMLFSFMVDIEVSESTTRWPLPNVWLGVSAENQETADERIPLLLNTPAAIRFVSYEPALGYVDWNKVRRQNTNIPWIDWMIAGGESGHGARSADSQWFKSAKDHCAKHGVSFFMKQMGSVWAKENFADKKGGNMMRWPESLKVREFPEMVA